MACFGLIFLLGATLGCSVSGKLLYYSDVSGGDPYAVTYDNRSFIVAGNRTFFLSGSVHYPRSTPAMWDGIFQAMIDDGLNMIETYVFWNVHEPVQGEPYTFDGYANLTLFIEKAARAGLFVNLRIGPYVCAEWNWGKPFSIHTVSYLPMGMGTKLMGVIVAGGLPLWLRNIKGMAVRSSNAPWQTEMARFVNDIAKLVTPYLAKNGGPIVLAQIENEYNWKDPAYVQWCGDLANGLKLGIPWLMCNGESANNTINSCNGNDCSKYASTHAQKFPGQPLAWTENEGWFEEWDKAPNSTDYDNRTPQDMAYVILKWFARGGSHHNYYMWYGGNHFGQWAANGVTNKYANGVNLHHDTLPNEPKKTHLKTLHQVLAKYSQVMLNTALKDILVYHVKVFDPKTKRFVTSTQQWAFDFNNQLILLENDADSDVEVLLGTKFFFPKANSVLVIDYGSLKVMYDSADVSYTNLPIKRVFNPLVDKLSWKAWKENVSDLQGGFLTSPPLEQLNLTMTDTDYLFYQTRVKVSSSESYTVRINSTDANAFLAFIDGELQNSSYNTEHRFNNFNVTYSLQVTTNDTDWHNLTLLSVNLGTNNGVSPGSFDSKGIVHGVTLNSEDLTTNLWLHRPKLEGEIKQIFTTDGSTKVVWDQDITKYVKKPVVWFQAEFTHVEVKSGHSMLLDLAGMGRGHIFLNGFPLGRYWSIKVDGVYVQRYYFIPPDLIEETNLLTLVEELGAADPAGVNIVDSTFVVP